MPFFFSFSFFLLWTECILYLHVWNKGLLLLYNNYYDSTTARTEAGTSSPGLDYVREIDEDQFCKFSGIVWM